MTDPRASSLPRPVSGIPSAIPRPATSRLPVLRSSVSHSQLRAPASSDQLRRKPSLSTIGATATATATLHRKASRASMANPPANRAPVAASRRVSGIPSIILLRPITNTTTAAAPTNNTPAFRRPFARPPSRQSKPPVSSARSLRTPQDEDTLGRLDGFRSASRASSRAESSAGFRDSEHELEQEPTSESAVESDSVAMERSPLAQPTPTKKSRPSLSERTVESLSQLPSSLAASKTRRRSSFFTADNTMGPPLRPASAMSSNGSRPTTSDGPPYPIPATTSFDYIGCT